MKILAGIDWFVEKVKGFERWVKTASAFVRSVEHFRGQCKEIWGNAPAKKKVDTSISDLAKEGNEILESKDD